MDFGDEVQNFFEGLYEGKLKDIRIYLSTMKKQEGWMDKIFKNIRHQFYDYLLKDGFLWKTTKRSDKLPIEVNRRP